MRPALLTNPGGPVRVWAPGFPPFRRPHRPRLSGPIDDTPEALEKRWWAPLVNPWGSPGLYFSGTTINIIST